ncbi:hypothetical protein MKW94_022050 [Papaver nudicaule]|uniref:Neprosin PEP catalytic domain-containing protein n=1 Tax=Papaver nudicaule TaxID=74823 RepID=A0AA41SCJ1_PAPNU|nr:hypothetical protein [Papaver nudicaule]
MKPTFFPTMESSSTTRSKPSILKASAKCPEGTVPIRRTQKDDLTNAKPPKANFGGNDSSNSVGQYIAGYLYQAIGEAYYGVSASINVFNPDMVASDQFSAAEIMVAAGPFTEMNAIYAGWMVQPNLYGNNDTRLFAFTTIDGGKTGCYNTLCPGFVQVDPSFTPSTPLLDKYSTFGGTQHTIDVNIYQDPATKNWWLMYEKNISIGYWPNSLFPLFTAGGSFLYWGGNVMNAGEKPAPRMGSGRFPDGDYQHACYFEHIQYIDASYKPVDPQADNMKEMSHQCGDWYRVRYFGLSKEGRGHTFQFGGPGGICY